MVRFLQETGVQGSHPPDRYLWTDAYAVCNLLGLYESTQNKQYLNSALRLISQVHEILGKYHPDDPRTGWLGSGDHPTINGLRIGKTQTERPEKEKLKQSKEWDRDGQYFHYNMRWIHSLIRTYRVTQQPIYLMYATDLAHASTKFCHGNSIYWKMSTDLSYPLVRYMGKHDPLDGYLTFSQLLQIQETPTILDFQSKFREMISSIDLETTDPLGLGGLMCDLFRMRLMNLNGSLSNEIRAGIRWGIDHVSITHDLAFRELGLAIGIAALDESDLTRELVAVREQINKYWQTKSNFTEHRQINTVMLATSLKPTGFLKL